MRLNKGIEVTLEIKLKSIIKKTVNGDVFVFFQGDTLFIDITTEPLATFRYNEYDIADKVCKGITADEIVNNCLKQYKKSILSKFFK